LPRPSALWRPASLDDIGAMLRIEAVCHPLFPERAEIHAEKIGLFGAGCRVLAQEGVVCGYGLSYPYRLGVVPPLDRFMGSLRADADCLFIHDVALLPQARGQGAAGTFVGDAADLAWGLGLAHLALVSVYGTTRVWARYGFVETAPRGEAGTLAGYGATARYMVAGAVGTKTPPR
jgi:GNAT superfamily N-acetyltransferase